MQTRTSNGRDSTGFQTKRATPYVHVPPHGQSTGLARNQAPQVSGEPRIARLVTAQRDTLAAKVAQREKAFNAAADVVKVAQVTRRQYDTKETGAALTLAGQNLTFAAEDLAVERSGAQAFEDQMAGSATELARLAELDEQQAEPAILAASQAFAARITEAGRLLARAIVDVRAHDGEVARARGEAQQLSRQLGLAWTAGPLGYDQYRGAAREALRAAFVAAGLDFTDLETLAR
jgi:hypothetical protein